MTTIPAWQASILEAVSRHSEISAAVERAFNTVDRAPFVPYFYKWDGTEWAEIDATIGGDNYRNAVYSNTGLATQIDPGSRRPISSSTMPSLMVEMLCDLNPQKGQTILEIGTGTGYNAALLSQIVGSSGSVYTVESSPDVAAAAQAALTRTGYDNVHVVSGTNLDQLSAIQFDSIIATAGFSAIPADWWDSTAAGGTLVVPLRHPGGTHPVVRLTKALTDTAWSGQYRTFARFMPAEERGSRSFPTVAVVQTDADSIGNHPVSGLADANMLDLAFFASLEIGEFTDVRMIRDRSGDQLAGPGIRVTEHSASLITRTGIKHCGADGERAGDVLARTVERWINLGRPSIRQYQIESTPGTERWDAYLACQNELRWTLESGTIVPLAR